MSSPGSLELLSNCYVPSAKWGAAMIGSYLLTNGIMRLLGWKESIQLQRLAGYVGMYPFYVLMCVYAHLGAHELYYAGANARTFESTPNSETFAYIYISSNIVAALGQVQTESGMFLVQLMAHHVLSLVCFGAGYYFDRYRFWMSLAGCCEITNLFLVPIFAGKELPQIKEQMWYKINGLFLYATFITHRFVLFPVWLYVWYKDQDLKLITNNHPLETYGYSFTIAALLLLSLVWFQQIHRGVVNSWYPGTYSKHKLE
jgi:hypothetical protein